MMRLILGMVLSLLQLSCDTKDRAENNYLFKFDSNKVDINEDSLFSFNAPPIEMELGNRGEIVLVRQYYEMAGKRFPIKEVAYYDHEKGRVRSVEFFRNGKLDGFCFYFYENGSIFEINNYYNGIQRGNAYTFYQTPKKKLDVKFFMVPCLRPNHKRVCRQDMIKFDTLGKILFDSSYVRFSFDKKEYRVGDTAKIRISLSYPEFTYSAVTLGNFDPSYSLLDSVGYTYNFDTSSTHSVHVHLPVVKLGKNMVRGYIEDIEPVEIDKDGYMVKYKSLYYYFDESVNVVK